MRPRDLTEPEPYWVYALAGALLTGGPVWHYLFVSDYPLRPEAIVLPIGGALVGALIAVFAARSGNFIATIVCATLLLVFVDLQFDLHKHIPTLLIAVVCIGLAHLFRQRLAIIVCVTLGAFYLVTLPRLARDRAPRPSSVIPTPALARPLLVHVILDEQWGTGGLRAAGDSATAAFLEDFYLDHGFEIYSGAYSRWSLTKTSIPDLLSLGQSFARDSLSAPVKVVWGEQQIRLRSNPYFERLRQRGYTVHVYQSGYLDYCNTHGAEVTSCDRTRSNSISNLGYLRGPWTRRALIVSRFFLNVTSNIYVTLHPDTEVWRRAVIGGAVAQFDLLVYDLVTLRPAGAAFFVHVLMPHRPVEVDSECHAKFDRTQPVTTGRRRNPMSDSSWRAALHEYAEQTRCAHRSIAHLLAAIDSTLGRDRSIVIIHGDHGSRMLRHGDAAMHLSAMDAGQLNSLFSTLLAIRRPGIRAAVHPQPVPLQDFMWQLIQSDFTAESPGRWRHFVRAAPSDVGGADTLRMLDLAAMVWAAPAARVKF